MTLEIIIPHYKEPEEVIKPLLDSIVAQQNIDFNDLFITIINDGQDYLLSHKFLATYNKLKLQYIQLPEHCGVSATRQYGLDKTNAKYIMFCDSDDAFCNTYGLSYIYKMLSTNDFDIISSDVITEGIAVDIPKLTIDVMPAADYLCHGKIFNVNFLRKYNIRWNSTLSVHEDTYFATLATVEARNVVKVPFPFYAWKYNEASVTKHSNHLLLNTAVEYIKASIAIQDELFRRYKPNLSLERLWITFYSIFALTITLQSNDFYKQKIPAVVEESKIFYNKYKKYLDINTNKCHINHGEYIHKAFCYEEFRGQLFDLQQFIQWYNQLDPKNKLNIKNEQ